MQIGSHVRARRTALGLSQIDLASELARRHPPARIAVEPETRRRHWRCC